MIYKFDQFDVNLEVKADGARVVRVLFKNGKLAADLSELSIDGVGNLAELLPTVKRLYYDAVDHHYAREQAKLSAMRAARDAAYERAHVKARDARDFREIGFYHR